jgi:hypothetical protein
MCGNQNVIKLLENIVFHDRNKHIAIRHHFIRANVGENEIEISYVISFNQFANIFTKCLGCTLFENLRSELGMVNTIYSSQSL